MKSLKSSNAEKWKEQGRREAEREMLELLNDWNPAAAGEDNDQVVQFQHQPKAFSGELYAKIGELKGRTTRTRVSSI